MASDKTRAQIVALKETCFTSKQIENKRKVFRKTIYNVLKLYRETGTSSTKPIPVPKRSVRTKGLIEKVKKRVNRNPTRSMRSMARGINISQTTIRRVVKEDLGLKALKMQHRHLTSAASKQRRLDRGKKMLEEMQGATDKVLVWSDEKIFTVEAVFNLQNDKSLCHEFRMSS